MSFSNKHQSYIQVVSKSADSEFSLKTIENIEPMLAFFYEEWWKVELAGLQYLPANGPALIVGNSGGIMPWAALMLMYALMKDKQQPRKLNVLADLDWIEDMRLYNFLREIGFASFSSDNAKRLFSEGQTVIVLPEGTTGALKPFGERYRVRSFDWTKLLSAVEMHVPIIPLATLGPDESFPVAANWTKFARLLSLPAYPVTPFFPWFPFPLNLYSLPVKWKMRLMKRLEYDKAGSREQIEEISQKLALFAEGEVQAELNRLLRMRVKSLF